MKRVAYQGVPGAFGHAACLAFLPDCEAVPYPTFEEAEAAAARGETDFALLPVRNTNVGLVPQTEPIFKLTELDTLDTYRLPVRMHLLGAPGSSLPTIRRAVSHPMAIKQCARNLAALGLDTVEADNTAMAAAALRDSGDTSTAVLASEAAASVYGLVILRSDLQDGADNATIFAVLGRAEEVQSIVTPAVGRGPA